MECQYCKKKLINNSSFNKHQTTTLYCLKLQGKDVISFNCEGCNKSYTSKFNLELHIKKCKKIKTWEEKYQDIQKRNAILEHENKILRDDKKDLNNRYDTFIINALAIPNSDTTIEIDEYINDDEKEECELDPLNISTEYTIEYRDEDGYINVTNLCKSSGRKLLDWLALEKTSFFLQALSLKSGIHTNYLIKYSKIDTKIDSVERYTWTHPQVAVNIAQWISPKFDVNISGWIYEVMMTGKVDITNTKTYIELQKENKDKELKIKFLTKKYVKSQSREKYTEKYIVYIITTKRLRKDRIYILGKTINLTNRLSTYNKTDEHIVIYYQQCKDEKTMGVVEHMVFNKLQEYREQANRERFILPNNMSESYFIDKIKECVDFFTKS
jgi:cell division protein FtsB